MTHKQICLDCKKPVCSHCCVEIANSPAKKYECCRRHSAFPQRLLFSSFTETSACATSARKYVIFTRRLAHGSTRVFPITSFRAIPTVICRAMFARHHPRSRRRQSWAWRLSRTRRRMRLSARRQRLLKMVRLAALCLRVAISSIFVCRPILDRDWRLTATYRFRRSLPTRRTAAKRARVTRKNPLIVFSRSRLIGRVERQMVTE